MKTHAISLPLLQVKFVFEAFSRMRPGVVLMALHGKVKQMKRIQATQLHSLADKFRNTLQLFYDFCKRDAAVLFATDVAARSAVFPAIFSTRSFSNCSEVLISHRLIGLCNSTAPTLLLPTFIVRDVRAHQPTAFTAQTSHAFAMRC